ncbi:Cystatin [Parasponia andersonii]|uniref:Cysteine proteinase inhibitor n=1 Tax=Parasponia andersonii TaxID=3476 RepID=A0A2P5E065_PARAD|nr:Cystatin [Parasponia andersonii]
MNPSRFSIAALLSFSFLLFGLCELGFCREEPSAIRMKLGGFRDVEGSSQNNNALIETLARFAVQEHNKQQNAILEFARVLKAREQVVAGKIYHLTLEAIDSGKKKIYEARVWVKPWMNFKQLQEFKYAHDGPSFTSSDLGFKRDGHGMGWQAVPLPSHDSEVQDAANHAVKSLQLKSNSLFTYELLDILLAKAKVIEDYLKFELLLKVKRGITEEKFRVEVNKNIKGEYCLTQMEQVHS